MLADLPNCMNRLRGCMIMDTTLFDAMLFSIVRSFWSESVDRYVLEVLHASKSKAVYCSLHHTLIIINDSEYRQSAFQLLFPNTTSVKSNIAKKLETSTKVWLEQIRLFAALWLVLR
jgi:hypothetical protein